MYKRICVTDRKLVRGDFLNQMEKVMQIGCDAVILREKDLPQEQYEQLAIRVLSLCRKYQIKCFLHTYAEMVRKLGADGLHLSFDALMDLSEEQKEKIPVVGASVHSVNEAVMACQAGVSYLVAGHIFPTECKKGAPPRGLDFLHSICENVPVPVYAIGGIHTENERDCICAGAAGICRMSSFMKYEF